MRLDDLCQELGRVGFPSLGERAHPDRELVLAARSSVERAVADDGFLADCIDAELRLIESRRLRRGLVPFLTMTDLGIGFAFGYWAPGDRAGAHEHTAWTISAVCRNHLEVLTFHRAASYHQRRLVPKNLFPAPAGKVGYIAEPCIHEPRNTSGDWSLSLHVTSPLDGEPPGDFEGPLPGLRTRPAPLPALPAHPYAGVASARRRNRCVHQLARVLLPMRAAAAPGLVERCVALGSPVTTELVARARGLPARSVKPSARVLVRAHPDLGLDTRRAGGMVALVAETPNGPVEDFMVNDVAQAAMAFVAREQAFSVADLPGDLSSAEKAAIADALVDSGLFGEGGREDSE
jgi:hypothetical protein